MTMTMIAAASQQKRSGRPFIIKVQHTSSFTVTLPLLSGAYNYNFIINWGDGAVGQVTAYNDADRIHTYVTGTNGGQPWVITMTGTLEGWNGQTYPTGVNPYLVEITQFGRTGFKFCLIYTCPNLVASYGKFISSQTTLAGMYYRCTKLTTCQVADWDVSNITSVASMFSGDVVLTSVNLSNWNVSKITNFGTSSDSGMFYNNVSLTSVGDLSGWSICTTSDVTFYSFLQGCVKITTIGDISGWNMSRVTTVAGMFWGCSLLNNINVTNWILSKCTSFYYFCRDCYAFTSFDGSGWTLNTTSNITMYGMFLNCNHMVTLTIPVNSKVTSIAAICQSCSLMTTVNVSSWDVQNVTTMAYAFLYDASLAGLAISGWNTANCTAMEGFVMGCSGLLSANFDPSGWNVTKVISFGYGTAGGYGMLANCSSLTTLNLSGWVLNSTSNINFNWFIRGCSNLTSIGDVSGWSTTKITSMYASFALSKLDAQYITNWNVSNVTEFGYIFQSFNGTNLDVSGWNVSKGINFAYAFNDFKPTSLNVTNWNVSSGTSFQGMFNSSKITGTLDLSGWTLNTTSNITMLLMFAYAVATEIKSKVNSKVTNMSYLCCGCANLSTLDVSGWDVQNVTDCSYAFCGCPYLVTLDVSGWNTGKVVKVTYMCYGCTRLTTFLTTSWTTTAITNCAYAFKLCPVLDSDFTDSKWWTRSPAIATTTQCFNGATAELAKYPGIPAGWK